MKRAIFKEIFVCSFFCFFFVFLTLFLCICYNQKRKRNANIPTKLLIHNNNTRTILILNSKQHIFTNLKNKIHNNTAITTTNIPPPQPPTNHCHLQFDRKKINKTKIRKNHKKLASSTDHITGHYKWNSSIAAQLQSGGYYQLSPAAAAPTTASVITANISISTATTATSTYAYNQ